MADKKKCEHAKTRKHDLISVTCRDCGSDLMRTEPTNATILAAIEKLTTEVQCMRALTMMPSDTTISGWLCSCGKIVPFGEDCPICITRGEQ